MKKKYTGTEWSENRFARFQLGVIIALLFVFYAFQYESARPIYLADTSVFDEGLIEHTVSVSFNTRPIPKQIIQSTKLSTEIEVVPVEIYKPDLINTDPSADQTTDKSSEYKYEKAVQLPLPKEKTSEIKEITSNEAVTFAEQMPLLETCMSKFETYAEQRECTTAEIMKVIRKHLNYPVIARENGIEGTVTASFVVNTKGEITEIKIVREAGFGLDEAVLEVFQKIPDLMPGEQNGRKVNVKMYVPVKFKLAN